jgi:rare lipoprotein A
MVAPMIVSAPRWTAPWPVLAAVLIALLAGCAAGPPRAGRDGPEAHPPADLARVPDAEPKVEPIRSGGPNKPYEVLGHSYVPIARDAPFTERGMASWYGRAFHGKRTASGEVYNMYAMTAAHPTLPIPSYARVRNPANGREIVVRVNDRGPFHGGRILDLSYTAALKLDLLRGVAPVEVQRITFDEIRTGAWRRDSASGVTVAATATAPPSTSATAPPSSASPLGATPPPQPTAQVPEVAPASPPEAVVLASASAAATPTTSVPTPDATSTASPVAAPALAAPVADAPAARAYTGPARGFWVQLGVFRQREGAESFHQRVVRELDWLAPLLAVFSDAPMFRLQAGPYPSRSEARAAAERIREGLQLVPVIVERR